MLMLTAQSVGYFFIFCYTFIMKKSQNVLLTPLLIAIVALLIIAGIFYYYNSSVYITSNNTINPIVGTEEESINANTNSKPTMAIEPEISGKINKGKN